MNISAVPAPCLYELRCLGLVAICPNGDLREQKQLIRERLRSCAQKTRYALGVLRVPPRPPRTIKMFSVTLRGKKVFSLPLRGSTTPYSYHPDPMITPS